MGADSAQARERDGSAVAANRAGGEPEGVPALSSLLEPGKPEPLPLPLALPGLDEVAERPVKVPESLLAGAFGVLSPPRQGRVGLLLRVPQLVQVHPAVPL